MSKLFNSSKFKDLFKARKGSVAFTGIEAGRKGSNTGQPANRPGPRGRPARTPLGPDSQAL